MGNIFGAVRSVERKRPTDLALKKRLNDHVWEFYSPEEGVPDVEIIFFHGLQLGDFEEAFWTTWLALEEECVIWPKEWLSEILPKARILSIDYSSSAIAKGGCDSYILVENLVSSIIGAHIGENCPVILVGHCLGGIVIKRFLLTLQNYMYSMNYENDEKRRISKLFENCQGVFFYATPHGGSPRLEDLIRRLRLQSNSPNLKLLECINQEASRVNAEFRVLCKKWGTRTFAVSEGCPTTYQGFDDIVVSEVSARLDVDIFYTVPMADHFTVCRARSQRDRSVILRLVQFIAMTSNKITVSRDVDSLY